MEPSSLAAAHAQAHTARAAVLVLRFLHYAYPLLLLFFFLVAFTARSIRAAPKAKTDNTVETGPGGKPLPPSDPARNKPKPKVDDDITVPQKRIIEWVSLIAALTFVANGANVVSHALSHRADGWWCGEPVVVRFRHMASSSTYCIC